MVSVIFSEFGLTGRSPVDARLQTILQNKRFYLWDVLITHPT